MNRSIVLLLCLAGCATNLPQEKHSTYEFPKGPIYIEEPTGPNQDRPFEVMGWVKSRARFPTLEQDAQNNPTLCRNYYNKAAADLLKEGKKAGADAVIKVRSVVLLLNGKYEDHVTPECSDDGAEGEVLMRGIAVKWKPKPSPTPAPNSTPSE